MKRKKGKPEPLIPPDMKQCQAEILQGSFMTLGPRSRARCSNKPTKLLTEVAPDEHGRVGSMTVCDDCYEAAARKYFGRYARGAS